MNGKGDAPRNCFSETYRQNYDDIFRKKDLTAEEITARAVQNGWYVWPATKPSNKRSSLANYKQVFGKLPNQTI